MIELYLLGGSGRIGRALVDSLVGNPIPDLGAVRIYCDSTKIQCLNRLYSSITRPVVTGFGYSAFNSTIFSDSQEEPKQASRRRIVINLRGVNNKQQWLNQPLDCLELHASSCRALIDANAWMQSNVEFIHLSSQLCDLIEAPLSLNDICEGQESYRRPYMVSRLHQEMLLTANAFQHSIVTSFLRLPAVYGFADDLDSPWVLNSLCKQKKQGLPVKPRHPTRIVSLTHREPLIECLRSLIVAPDVIGRGCTVKYIRPPMLRLTVASLATLVQSFSNVPSPSEIAELDIKLVGDISLYAAGVESHLKPLLASVEELLGND